MKLRADLHVHTYFSDGTLSCADIASAAVRAGVNILAKTDHDTQNGCAEFESECKSRGVIPVGGVEISAYSSVKVHVLGYNLDRECAAYKKFFSGLYDGAEERTRDILKKLARCGVKVSYEEVVKERKSAASPVHTFYIARAASRKGYGRSPVDFYMTYLNAGCRAYSAVCRPTPEQAVEVIKACGGVSSLAHPGRITLADGDRLNLIDALVSCGLDGIEAEYSGHTVKETAYYKEIAESRKLLVTGGSDTHHAEGGKRVGTPEFYPDERLLAALKIN